MKHNETVVKTLVKQGLGIFDPAKLISLAGQEDLMLLESADVVTKLGEKSMLFLDCALKIESRLGNVAITALMQEGIPLQKELAHRFGHLVKSFDERELILHFQPLFHQLDLLKKMRSLSALDVLRAIMDLLNFHNEDQRKKFMLVGTLSYDFLDHFEKLPPAQADIHHYPDYLFYVPLTAIVLDHKTKQHELIAHEFFQNQASLRLKRAEDLVRHSGQVDIFDAVTNKVEAQSQQGWSFDINTHEDIKVDISHEDFGKLVATCKEYIASGDVYQIVPSRTFSIPMKEPLFGYHALRLINPSPYMFYMQTREWTLLGASPETFIKVDKDGLRVSIRPIAGTRRRGFHKDGTIDEELDSREQASLCLDEKELAEHMMLVDLARNDIASVCKPRSRRIKRMLSVDRFSHVMHLVSEVEGRLLPDFDALSAYQASMNMGTLMGAPKVRAAELLRTLEASKRGFYGGAVGYIDGSGNMDTSIIIRSALVHDNMAYVRAGCGVVSDSNIQFEVTETLNKAEATLRALALVGSI